MREQIYEETGFLAYTQKDGSLGFYGASAKYNDFKALADDNFPVGTFAFLCDTKEVHFYDTVNGWN